MAAHHPLPSLNSRRLLSVAGPTYPHPPGFSLVSQEHQAVGALRHLPREGCLYLSASPVTLGHLPRRTSLSTHMLHAHTHTISTHCNFTIILDAKNTQHYTVPFQVLCKHHIQASQQPYEIAAAVTTIPILQSRKLRLNKDRNTLPRAESIHILPHFLKSLLILFWMFPIPPKGMSLFLKTDSMMTNRRWIIMRRRNRRKGRGVCVCACADMSMHLSRYACLCTKSQRNIKINVRTFTFFLFLKQHQHFMESQNEEKKIIYSFATIKLPIIAFLHLLLDCCTTWLFT